MPLRTDFGSFRQPVNPAAQLSNVLAGLQSQLSDYDKQKLAEERQAALLAQQAAEGKRAERSLALREKEYKRAKEQDEALGKALLGIDPTMTSTSVVPASTREGVLNLEEIAKAEADKKAALLTKGKQEVAGETYTKLFEQELQKLKEQQASTTGPGEFTGEVSHFGIPLRAGESAIDKPYLPAGIAGADAPIGIGPRKTYTRTGTPRVTDPSQVEVTPMMLEQAGQLALEKSGITDTRGKAILPTYQDIVVPEKIMGEVTIPEKRETSKLSKSEWLSRELEKAKDLKLGGAAAKNYHDILTKRADQLYGEQKPMTLGDQLKALKYQQEQKTKQLTMQDYENMYPTQKGKIKTLDGWKAYETKVGKAANKKFNIGEELYKTMSGKDSGDVDAIFEFLSKNNEKLGNMLPDELRTLAAQLKAKYAGESGWDISDFLGGSAAGDVLGDITLQ